MNNVQKNYIIERADIFSTICRDFNLYTIYRKDHPIWSRIKDIDGIYDFEMIDYKATYKVAKCFSIEKIAEEIKSVIEYFIKMQEET